jgi:hypothetical protein
VRSNIRSYSRIERPHGTMLSNRALIPLELTLNLSSVQAEATSRSGDASPADRNPEGGAELPTLGTDTLARLKIALRLRRVPHPFAYFSSACAWGIIAGRKTML